MMDLESRITRLEKARAVSRDVIVRIFGALTDSGMVETERTSFGALILDPRSEAEAKNASQAARARDGHL